MPTPGERAGRRARWGALRSRADALVVTLHVLGGGGYLPGPALTAAVEDALAAGAAVVAAHGTHRVGRVVRRGDAVIAWGLGNVAMACGCTDETEALLLDVVIGGDGRAGEARVVPLAAGLGGEAVAPSPDAPGIYDLLAAIGSGPLTRAGPWATLGDPVE